MARHPLRLAPPASPATSAGVSPLDTPPDSSCHRTCLLFSASTSDPGG
uniref:Uncharacterized protein n=1 Tax=Arundo donax TaxID=35708 RepID=A0A0A8Z730_ARUDO